MCVCVCVDADGSCPFLPVSQVSYREHSAPITHCKFSPNATQVASVDTDGRMRLAHTQYIMHVSYTVVPLLKDPSHKRIPPVTDHFPLHGPTYHTYKTSLGRPPLFRDQITLDLKVVSQ